MCLDLAGPLLKSINGFKYIVVVVDLSTKWPEEYPLRNIEVTSIASRIMDDFVCRFGCREGSHSDQGQNLEGSIFHGLCHLIDSAKSHTTPYLPQSDPAERMIQNLTTILRTLVSDNQRDWGAKRPQNEHRKHPHYFPLRYMLTVMKRRT